MSRIFLYLIYESVCYCILVLRFNLIDYMDNILSNTLYNIFYILFHLNFIQFLYHMKEYWIRNSVIINFIH